MHNLDATDENGEGVRKGVNGSQWGYTNWDTGTGQPNNAIGIEHYLELYNGGF
jgi:hypothetical protein